jgi:ABC-2 type transport system permease protein
MTTTLTSPTTGTPTREEQAGRFTGLGVQLRFIARRDRVRGAVWILAVVGFVALSTASVLGLYSTPDDLATYADVAQADAAFKALTGPGYGLDDPTEGAVVMNEVSLYTYVAIALMASFLVVRHTRAEEDSGRAELVRAAPVGRDTALTATCLWVVAITSMIAIGLFLVLVSNGLPVTGSAAFGVACFAVGVVFVGIAALAAQLASTSRAANSLAGIALGASFLLRAVGDMGTTWMTWISPLGITQAIRPYADERWWVLVPLAVVAAGSLTVAAALVSRRDLGAGFIAQRPGAPTGSRWLSTPLALAARLQRASVIGWAVGIGIAAFSFGLVVDQAESLADNEAIAEVIASSGDGTITEQFLASLMLMVAILTSGFTVASVLRLRTEEAAGRADPVLATPVSRIRWWASHTTIALTASLILVVIGGLGLGLGYTVQAGDTDQLAPMVGAAVAMFAAIALVGAITALLVAVQPHWAPAAWLLVATATVVGFLAETIGLPQWLRDLSPFEHVPALPAASFAVLPIAALTVLSALSLGAAALAVDRRDIG